MKRECIDEEEKGNEILFLFALAFSLANTPSNPFRFLKIISFFLFPAELSFPFILPSFPYAFILPPHKITRKYPLPMRKR